MRSIVQMVSKENFTRDIVYSEAEALRSAGKRRKHKGDYTFIRDLWAIKVCTAAKGVAFKEGKKKSRAFLNQHKSTLKHIDEPEAKKTLVEQFIKEAYVATGQLSSSVDRLNVQDINNISLIKGFLGNPFKRQQYRVRHRELAKVIAKDVANH